MERTQDAPRAGRPAAVAVGVPLAPRSITSRELVAHAAQDLVRQGWTVVERNNRATAPWHLVAKRGARRRIVQVAPPETPSTVRQERRLELGEAARLAWQDGTMEQWLAHVRPDGRVSFGAYVLSGQRWNLA